MQDFDTVIRDFIERNVVTVEDGVAFATNQNNLTAVAQRSDIGRRLYSGRGKPRR